MNKKWTWNGPMVGESRTWVGWPQDMIPVIRKTHIRGPIDKIRFYKNWRRIQRIRKKRRTNIIRTIIWTCSKWKKEKIRRYKR